MKQIISLVALTLILGSVCGSTNCMEEAIVKSIDNKEQFLSELKSVLLVDARQWSPVIAIVIKEIEKIREDEKKLSRIKIMADALINYIARLEDKNYIASFVAAFDKYKQFKEVDALLLGLDEQQKVLEQLQTFDNFLHHEMPSGQGGSGLSNSATPPLAASGGLPAQAAQPASRGFQAAAHVAQPGAQPAPAVEEDIRATVARHETSINTMGRDVREIKRDVQVIAAALLRRQIIQDNPAHNAANIEAQQARFREPEEESVFDKFIKWVRARFN